MERYVKDNIDKTVAQGILKYISVPPITLVTEILYLGMNMRP
jgi:hypothetical protein